MKVTLVHRYFWPDKAPYAQMLYHIASGLVEANHDVSVLSSMPTHHVDKVGEVLKKEEVNGVKVERFSLLPEPGRMLVLRAVNSWLFGIRVFASLLFSKNDFVMVATTPPVIVGMFVRLASYVKKYRYVYHCQDLHPEAMAALGLRRSSIVYKAFNSIDKSNVIDASKVVVLSDDMRNTLSLRKIPIDNVSVLNNFVFENHSSDSAGTAKLDNSYFNILFAGNLGKFQGLQYLIEAAWETQNNNQIRYIIVGDGVERARLEESAGELLGKTVFFYGHLPIASALQFMKEANIGLIMLNSRVIEYAYPSKTIMYMSTGLPLLVAVEKNSSLARMVASNGFGYVCNPEDTKSLTGAVLLAYHDRASLKGKSSQIENHAVLNFGKEQVLRKWAKLYESLHG